MRPARRSQAPVARRRSDRAALHGGQYRAAARPGPEATVTRSRWASLRAVRRPIAIIALLLAGAVPAARAAEPPDVTFPSYVVADGRDGRILAEQQADAPRAIASITKMMTAYLALQAGALEQALHRPGRRDDHRRVDRRPARRTPRVRAATCSRP